MSRLSGFSVLVAAPLLACAADPNTAAVPNADEILQAVNHGDMARRNAFPGYVGTRTYVVENKRFKVRATMKVHVAVDTNGAKKFEILEVTGPAAIRKMVFQRMLDTEAKASLRAAQDSTRMSPENYSVRLTEIAQLGGRRHFVVEAEPKTANPLLFRGKAWIDPDTWAVVRIQGAPAQKPSFWVNSTSFVHENRSVGGQWLAHRNHSETEVKVFGHTTVHIEYFDYALGAIVE